MPEFDQQKAQDLLTAAIAQRDQAMNGIVQLQAQVMKLERELAEVSKVDNEIHTS